MVASNIASSAESFVRVAINMVAQPLDLSLAEAQRVIRSSQLLRDRLKCAVKNEPGFDPWNLDQVLDCVFALDTVFLYRGWAFGMDVTLNPRQIRWKEEKFEVLEQYHRMLGIDRSMILLVSPELDLSQAGLRAMLSKAIASNGVITWR